jgi:hypothetical protein
MPILVFIVLAVLISFIGFLIKILKRGRMQRALGREVGDHELTSINSWMEVTEKEQNQRK